MTALALLALQSGSPLPVAPEMTSSGWIFMGAAWAFVLLLVIGSFVKVLWGGKST